MLAAPLRRFTVEEYHRLAEAGVLREDERVELLNGVIVPMMPIGPFHGAVVDWLAEAFSESRRGRWITRVQSVVQLGDHDEPQPDILLLKPRADFYRKRHPRPADVLLLIEVADSSLLVDRAEKLPAYAEAGIAEVWIVNLPQLVIEVYREPVAGAYSQAAKVRPGEPLVPVAFPDVAIDTAALLAPGAA